MNGFKSHGKQTRISPNGASTNSDDRLFITTLKYSQNPIKNSIYQKKKI